MNPTIQFFKKQGLKVSLPLLLLATACGEETPSAQQADAEQSASASIVVAAQPSSGFGNTPTGTTPPAAPEVSIDTDPEPTTIADVLPPAPTTDEATGADAVASAAIGAAEAVATVPEPTALAGLAIAAAGLIVVKRKQAA